MTDASGNRVVIIDKVKKTTRTRTDAELVQENEKIRQLLSQRSEIVTQDKDELKEAIRDDDLQALLARKKAEKEAAAKAKAEEKAAEETAEEAPEEPVEEAPAVKEEAPPPAPAPAKKKGTVGGEKRVSLNMGVVGIGQAGSKLAKVFYDLGYDVCIANTAKQDLELLDIPDNQKFFMDYSGVGGGGAGRELTIGKAAIEQDYNDVRSFVEEHTEKSDVLVLCIAGGGGTGSGGASTAVEMLNEIGKPVIVVYVLPGSTDDSQSKHNAIETLAELGSLAANSQINSLILVDNAKIELAFPDLSQAAFWKTANKAIVTPLHMFNSVTARPTDYEALDSMDFAKSLLEAGNCVLFGTTTIESEVYEEDETAIVEAIIDNLEQGLLASGFDLNEAQTVGILITAKQSVLERIPYRALSYAFKYMTSEYDSARTFKGVYAIPSDEDDLTVHFIFSGMGLPEERVKSLQTEAKTHMDNLNNKMKVSKDKMTIDMGKDRTSAKADKVMDKIRRKKNPMNKLIKGGRKGVMDRRR